MWIFDTDSLAILAVNNAVQELYGYSEEEFVRKNLADIRPSEDIPRLLESLRKLPGGLVSSGSWRHIRKDGKAIDVEIWSRAIEFEGCHARLSVILDVTEKRNAEREVARSESKWRSLVENAPNIILILDSRGSVQFINRQFASFDKETIHQK